MELFKAAEDCIHGEFDVGKVFSIGNEASSLSKEEKEDFCKAYITNHAIYKNQKKFDNFVNSKQKKLNSYVVFYKITNYFSDWPKGISTLERELQKIVDEETKEEA